MPTETNALSSQDIVGGVSLSGPKDERERRVADGLLVHCWGWLGLDVRDWRFLERCAMSSVK